MATVRMWKGRKVRQSSRTHRTDAPQNE